MNKPANAAQKKWMKDIAEWAENNIQILYGDEWSNKPIQLHHVLGRSAKNNKVHIGHEFVLPVPFDLHDVSSNHWHNVTHKKKAFVNAFGNQRDLFRKMVVSMHNDYSYKVPDVIILQAISDTNS